MSYDIYGNHLRPGYCEVHPDVRHEYPCPCCTDDYRREEERYEEPPGPTPEDMLLDHLRAAVALLVTEDFNVSTEAAGGGSYPEDSWVHVADLHEFVAARVAGEVAR